VGIAYDQYSNVSVLPFFISIRGDFLDNPITPFYFADLGSGPGWNSDDQFNMETDIDAGTTFHIGSGLRVYSSERINIMFSLGYKSQKVTFSENIWDGSHRITTRTYKSLSFRIGIGI
jgi:hypothetical protein